MEIESFEPITTRSDLNKVVMQLRLRQIPITLEVLMAIRDVIEKPQLDEELHKLIEREFSIQWLGLQKKHKISGWNIFEWKKTQQQSFKAEEDYFYKADVTVVIEKQKKIVPKQNKQQPSTKKKKATASEKKKKRESLEQVPAIMRTFGAVYRQVKKKPRSDSKKSEKKGDYAIRTENSIRAISIPFGGMNRR